MKIKKTENVMFILFGRIRIRKEFNAQKKVGVYPYKNEYCFGMNINSLRISYLIQY